MRRKVVRLPGGQFITRMLNESTPERIAAAKPNEIWMTKDERLLVIDDMEMRHLLNAMRELERRAKAIMAQFSIPGADELAVLQRFTGQMDGRYMAMQASLRKRAKPELSDGIAEHTERKFSP